MKTEKLHLASTGKEVKIGDQLKGRSCTNGIVSTAVITINEAAIPMLKAAGILVTSPPENSVPTVSAVIKRLANRLGWKPQKAEGYLKGVAEIMPMAAFNMVLREVAIMLDEKYPDHINKSEKIYCISSLDGRIHEVCKAHVKNYRNFAAFRTINDAKLACSILKEPLKEMFKSGK